MMGYLSEIDKEFHDRATKAKNEIIESNSWTIWFAFDADKTLFSDYMQNPFLVENGLKPWDDFWSETQKRNENYRTNKMMVDSELTYIRQMKEFVKAGKIKNFNLKHLRETGAKVELYPGLPDFFPKFKEAFESVPEFAKYGIKIEYYVISNGFSEIIRGSPIAQYLGNKELGVEGIYANEFDEVDGEMELRYIVTKHKKSEAVFHISKSPTFGVDDKVMPTQRRLLLSNLVYFGDGMSDIPVFTEVREQMGTSFGVYDTEKTLEEIMTLRDRETVKEYGPKDYAFQIKYDEVKKERVFDGSSHTTRQAWGIAARKARRMIALRKDRFEPVSKGLSY